MNFRYAAYPVLAAAVAMACGGSVSKSDAGGGADSPGGSASDGGSGSKAGTTSVGAGGSGKSGDAPVGGCAGVGCPAIACAVDEVLVREPGACCATCQARPTGCEDVKCEVAVCEEGYEPRMPLGACCTGCFPKPGGGAACLSIGCLEPKCPLGYVPANLYGGCCYDCVPDPLYCRTSEDCVIADKPRSCCGCPEAITLREYEADPCWSATAAPRMQPVSCFPQVICDAVCGPCPDAGATACIDHRCTARGLGLK